MTSLSTTLHPFASPLSVSLPLPGSWGLLLTWHLPPVRSVRVATAQPAGPSLAAVYRQEGPRCVTPLAPIKDNIITAPIVPVYICWWEEIIGLSELEQGMLENYESESCLCQETSALCWFNKGFFFCSYVNKQQFTIISPHSHGSKRQGVARRCGERQRPTCKTRGKPPRHLAPQLQPYTASDACQTYSAVKIQLLANRKHCRIYMHVLKCWTLSQVLRKAHRLKNNGGMLHISFLPTYSRTCCGASSALVAGAGSALWYRPLRGFVLHSSLSEEKY